MAAKKEQLKLKLLLLLGGTLSAIGSALSVIGYPEELPGPPPAEANIESPGDWTQPVRELAVTARKKCEVSTATANTRLTSTVVGPGGILKSTPVELVPLPRVGQPAGSVIKILTDNQGQFTFNTPPHQIDNWAICFNAPGYGLHAIPIADQGKSLPSVVKLTYSRWAKGSIVGNQGEYLTGTKIKVGIPLAEYNDSSVFWFNLAHSGKGGKFTLRGLPVNRKLFVMADDRNHVPTRPRSIIIPAGGAIPTIDFQLQPGRVIKGKVRRRSGNVGTRVQLVWEKILYGGAKVIRRAVSDDKGEFTLVGLPWIKGSINLWTISPRGRRQQVKPVPWKGELVVSVPW